VANSRTYSTAEAAELIGAPSERWLIERLRDGTFPGRGIGRHWRITDQDITDALDVCANDFPRHQHRTPRSDPAQPQEGGWMSTTPSSAGQSAWLLGLVHRRVMRRRSFPHAPNSVVVKVPS
jgi:hypothetical protein